jgi:nucleoid-associated protein YgaU
MRASIARVSGRRSTPARRVIDDAAQAARDHGLLRSEAAALGIQNLELRPEHGRTVVSGTARYALDRERLFDVVKGFDGWERNYVMEVDVKNREVRGYHTVEPGDTLESLAERYLGSAGRYLEILEANRDRMNAPDQLFPGQQLLIPRR